MKSNKKWFKTGGLMALGMLVIGGGFALANGAEEAEETTNEDATSIEVSIEDEVNALMEEQDGGFGMAIIDLDEVGVTLFDEFEFSAEEWAEFGGTLEMAVVELDLDNVELFEFSPEGWEGLLDLTDEDWGVFDTAVEDLIATFDLSAIDEDGNVFGLTDEQTEALDGLLHDLLQ